MQTVAKNAATLGDSHLPASLVQAQKHLKDKGEPGLCFCYDLFVQILLSPD